MVPIRAIPPYFAASLSMWPPPTGSVVATMARIRSTICAGSNTVRLIVVPFQGRGTAARTGPSSQSGRTRTLIARSRGLAPTALKLIHSAALKLIHPNEVDTTVSPRALWVGSSREPLRESAERPERSPPSCASGSSAPGW
jgi:hypothetical protein